MQTSVLEIYNQLTVQDQEKVTTLIYSLFSKYKKLLLEKRFQPKMKNFSIILQEAFH